jgi:hypothetical protein
MRLSKSDHKSNPSITLEPLQPSKFNKFLTQSKMNTAVDFTPVLLAQLTDLQMRVTKQDATIAALKAEVERLSGRSVAPSDAASTMRTSVPLLPKPSGPRMNRDGANYQRPGRPTGNSAPRPAAGGAGRARPKVAPAEKTPRPTMTLADVLEQDETVSIEVHTGKDEEGNFVDATATATFDGTDLTVTECELVESLVGMKSSKPGEILYKFIDELKSAGHIKRTFTIAPWKLCLVERDGIRSTLEELRNTVG